MILRFIKNFFSPYFLFFFFLLVSCKNEMGKISSYKYNDTIPLESARDIEYFYSENAVLKTKMTAALMKRYEKPEQYIEFSQGFKIEMYDTLGELNSTITANWARKYEALKLTEAKYNVVVTDVKENKTLNTNHLTWDENNKRIYSNEFVKITTPDKIIYGNGFESDEDFNDYKILFPKGEILITRKKDQQ